MSNIVTTQEPLEIILSKSIFEFPYLYDDFSKALKELWGFAQFKPMLDLCASKARAGNLKFKVSNKRFFELDEGNCKTIVSPVQGVLNRFRAEKRYEISIKKLDTSVIAHEVAHMVEQACELDITQSFTQIMVAELQSAARDKNNMAGSAINQVLIEEIKGYPKSQIASELFARIYQLIAQSKEIYGYAEGFAFSYKSICQSFAKTILWLKQNIDPKIAILNDADIVRISNKYTHKPNTEPNKNWSHKRVKSFHKKKTHSPKSKWSSSVDSIHD